MHADHKLDSSIQMNVILSLLVLANRSLIITEEALCYFDFSQYISSSLSGHCVILKASSSRSNQSFLLLLCFSLGSIPRGLARNTIVSCSWVTGSLKPYFCLGLSTLISARSVDPDFCLICRPRCSPSLSTPISAWSVDPYFCWGLSTPIFAWSFFLPGLSTLISAQSVNPDFCLGQPAVDSLPARKTRSTQNTTHTQYQIPCLAQCWPYHVLLLLATFMDLIKCGYSLSFH